MKKTTITKLILFAGFLFSKSVFSQIVGSVPPGYQPCAKDYGTCKVSGPWQGFYGAKGKFAIISGNNSFTCLPKTLNIPDPLPGVQKICYINKGTKLQLQHPVRFINNIPAGYKPCAYDYGKCRVKGKWQGVYGAKGKFAIISGNNSFTCLPKTLNIPDPLPGVRKTCYIKLLLPQTSSFLNHVPSGYKPCANDFGKCIVKGKWQGVYGANGKFAKISGNNSFTCLPNTFNIPDPLPGVRKTCFIKASVQTGTVSVSPNRSTKSATKNTALVWWNKNGQLHYWPIANGQPLAGKNFGPRVDNQWKLAGFGDLNGDGKDDIIWRRITNGQVLAWFSTDGKNYANIGPVVGKDWNLIGAGDLNNDGTDDLIWQNRNGQVHYWPIKNGQRKGGQNIDRPVSKDWRLIGAGDINNDGTDDLIWQNRNGQVHYWPIKNGQRKGGQNIGRPVGKEWRLIGVAKF